jgi:hypothetical protein
MRTASGYAWIAMVILFCAAMAILLVLSSGGAHAWFETRDAKLQSVKTVGIISAIGDQFTFAKAAHRPRQQLSDGTDRLLGPRRPDGAASG